MGPSGLVGYSQMGKEIVWDSVGSKPMCSSEDPNNSLIVSRNL